MVQGTMFRAPGVTQLTNQAGGTTAVSESQDIVPKWVDALNASSYQLYAKARAGGGQVDQVVHQWGERVKIKKDTTLASGVNNAVTTIPVATGDGLIMQAQGFIEIVDVRAGTTDEPDESTREVLFATSISSDNVTVAARGTYSPALSHSAGAIVRLIGSGEPEMGEHAEAPRIRGFRLFNYPQRFNAKLTADKRYQNQATWENDGTNALLRDYEQETEKQKELIERWMFVGTRYRGDYTPGATLPSSFGGLNTFLTTNSINLGGQMLGPGDMDAIMREIWYDLEGHKTQGMEWVMGLDEATILDTSINPVRRGTLQDDTLNTVVRTYKTRSGDIRVEPTWNVPRGNLYLVNWDWINLMHFKGLDWHKGVKKGEDHAVDHDVYAISGDFTLEVMHENAMARVYNFDMNLDNYPQAGYF